MYSVLMLQNEYICKINKFKNVNHYSFIASQTQTLSRGIAFALIQTVIYVSWEPSWKAELTAIRLKYQHFTQVHRISLLALCII